MKYIKICCKCDIEYEATGPNGKYCTNCKFRNIKVQRGIYLFPNGRYTINIKRESLGGNYSENFTSLKEAQEALIILEKEYPKEDNTGIYNNICRGGIIGNQHNFRLTRHNIISKTSFICNRCDKQYHVDKLNLHHIDHNRDNDNFDNFEILCVYCHREHHNTRDCNGRFN